MGLERGDRARRVRRPREPAGGCRWCRCVMRAEASRHSSSASRARRSFSPQGARHRIRCRGYSRCGACGGIAQHRRRSDRMIAPRPSASGPVLGARPAGPRSPPERPGRSGWSGGHPRRRNGARGDPEGRADLSTGLRDRSRESRVGAQGEKHPTQPTLFTNRCFRWQARWFDQSTRPRCRPRSTRG